MCTISSEVSAAILAVMAESYSCSDLKRHTLVRMVTGDHTHVFMRGLRQRRRVRAHPDGWVSLVDSALAIHDYECDNLPSVVDSVNHSVISDPPRRSY